jgi:formylglycine-generating enzyme required for sulfatase activity
MNKLQKSALIGVAAVVLSTVAIQASDVLRGVEGNLAGLVRESEHPCGEGAVEILLGSHALCVDIYEASAGIGCPYQDPQSPQETQENANEPDCKPQSKEGVIPWRFVSFTQAQQLCGRAGKRLPTNDEWYRTVSGFTDDASCNIASVSTEPAPAGSFSCMTPSGVSDMIGNVWEWVDEEIVDGNYESRMLPPSGYIAQVDTSGVVVETGTEAKDEFGKDYAWTAHTGVKGMLRGGFYGSKDDAGVFSQNMSIPLDFRTTGVGFRCVRDI